MGNCEDCRYRIDSEAKLGCLFFYNQSCESEKIRNGLVGKCEDHAPWLEYPKDEEWKGKGLEPCPFCAENLLGKGTTETDNIYLMCVCVVVQRVQKLKMKTKWLGYGIREKR